MKNYINNQIVIFRKFCYILFITVVSISCENEFNNDDIGSGVMEAPIITGVNLARTDTPAGTGVLGDLYYIRGRNLSSVTKITYNDYEAGFNPVLVTNNLIISRIPLEAPVLNSSNKLIVENPFGTGEFDFSLLTITGFEATVVDNRNAVIVEGGNFTDVSRVYFGTGSEEMGNLVELDATILDIQEDALTVEVPQGIIQAFIFVESNGSIARSESFGFNYPIFTDMSFGWDIGGFGPGDGQELSSEIALGSTSIKRTTDPFGALTFFPNADAEILIPSNFSVFTFQIYPVGDQTTRIKFAVNDFSADEVLIDVIPDQWNRIEVRLSDLYVSQPIPQTIDRIDIQEFSGGSSVFYIDEFGLLE